jgi:hypothetical protein
VYGCESKRECEVRRSGCEFITGMKLEMRGDGHAKAKQGKTSYVIQWLAEGEYIHDKYATCQVAT